MHWAVVFPIALGASCYQGVNRACEVACSVNPVDPMDRGPCPSGLTCGADGMCHDGMVECGSRPDGNPGDDAITASDGSGDGPAPTCPPGMAVFVADDFDANPTLAGWTLFESLGTGTATVDNGTAKIVRTSSFGALLGRTTQSAAVGLTRLLVTFDVSLDEIGTHEVVFTQLEVANPRSLVRLRTKPGQIVIEELVDPPGGAVNQIGSPFTLGGGFQHVEIDAVLAAPRNLKVTVGTAEQSLPTFVLAEGETLQSFFGAFVETSTTAGDATVLIDNVIVCTEL